jgi:aldehyde:ferredoxin oxidoreductase
VNPKTLNRAVHDYYTMMGWDPETGTPTMGKLEELGIGWTHALLP